MNTARFGLLFKKGLEWSSLAFLLLIIFVPAMILGWLVFFTKTFSVSSITIVDAKHTEEEVRTYTQDSLGKNILFVETGAVEQAIVREVPQVRSAHILRKLPGTLKIIIQEKQPTLLLVSSGTYYFVDSTGIAYANATLDVLPGFVLPTVKNADETGKVTLGTRAIDESFVSFLTRVQKELPLVTGGQVVEMRIPSLAAREVHFILDKNWKIMMDTTRRPEDQLSILKSLLTSTVSKEEQQTLEYIDLRIPNRIYYKTSSSRTATSP